MGSTAYLHLHYLLKAQHGEPVEQPFFQTKADYIDRVRPPSWKQTKHNNKGGGAGSRGGAGKRKGTPLLPLPFLYFHPVVLSLRITFWLAQPSVSLSIQDGEPALISSLALQNSSALQATACTIKTPIMSMEHFIKAYDD